MKRTLALTLLATLLATSAAVAQQTNPLASGISFIAGINRAKMDSDGSDDSISSRTGLVVGIGVVKSFSPSVAIAPELVWSSKGERVEITGGEGSIKIDYLDIPVLLRLRLPSSGGYPYLVLGPSLGFKLRCNLEAKPSTTDATVSVPCDDPDEGISEINTIDAGGVVGGGMAFTHGNHTIGLSIRYNIGLSNVWRGSGDTFLKHRVFQFLGTFELARGGR